MAARLPGSGAPRAPHAAPPAPADPLGVQLSDAPGGGARVDDVSASSAVHDLNPGDVIVEAGHLPVKDGATFRAALAKAKPGSTVLLKVRRGRLIQFAALPIPGT